MICASVDQLRDYTASDLTAQYIYQRDEAQIA